MENKYIDYNWQDHAACKGMDVNNFYPDMGKTVTQAVIDACQSCPVREECLTHALKYERYGYWALTSPPQRIKMRKQMGIKLEHIISILENDDIKTSEDIIENGNIPLSISAE